MFLYVYGGQRDLQVTKYTYQKKRNSKTFILHWTDIHQVGFLLWEWNKCAFTLRELDLRPDGWVSLTV